MTRAAVRPIALVLAGVVITIAGVAALLGARWAAATRHDTRAVDDLAVPRPENPALAPAPVVPEPLLHSREGSAEAIEPRRLVVGLRRERGVARTRVSVAGEHVGMLDDPRTLAAVQDRIRGIVTRAGVTADKWPGEVDATPHVPSTEVIQLVDCFIECGFADVTFVGSPPPGSMLEKLPRDAKQSRARDR